MTCKSESMSMSLAITNKQTETKRETFFCQITHQKKKNITEINLPESSSFWKRKNITRDFLFAIRSIRECHIIIFMVV